ncbi:peptidoglycan-binding protein [Gynuella sunshinyii]|uniref:peptidoglycan-binding protein n=1 Tax=Gynuella sunshinyii TaxID=1445505 RepID=UPI001184EF71|nr:peptidoglycan-binding protein [Gynuella sunshinyii]
MEQLDIPDTEELDLLPFMANQSLWLEVVLINDQQEAIANSEYLITAPDGTEYRGCTDSNGIARIEGLSHLSGYHISFPTLPIPSRLSSGQSTKPPVTAVINLLLRDSDGQAMANVRVSLTVGEDTLETFTEADGRLRMSLNNPSTEEGQLDVFLDTDSEKPSHSFQLQLQRLDSIDSISGIQARCNNLGFDCGEINGELNNKTQAAIKAFQATYGLTEDGEPGPLTKKKLHKVYGG